MAEEEVGHHLGEMGRVREEEGGRDGAALLAPLPSPATVFLPSPERVAFPTRSWIPRMGIGMGMGKCKSSPRARLCQCLRGQTQRTPWEEGMGWSWRHPLLLVPLGFTGHGATRLGTRKVVCMEGGYPCPASPQHRRAGGRQGRTLVLLLMKRSSTS